jgi:hypothetical protein
VPRRVTFSVENRLWQNNNQTTIDFGGAAESLLWSVVPGI